MLPAIQTVIPGPLSLELAARLRRTECRNTTFTSPDWPIFWDRAEGVNVWDADGNRFLDLTSAFGVAGLGHGATAHTASRQADRLVHAMGDVHPAVLKVELCEKLSALTFERWIELPGKTLLGNSGFESVEAALKTAALATGRDGVISFQNAYHGLGYGSLLGAGIPWFRRPFEGQLAPVTRLLPYPHATEPSSIDAFRQALAAVDPTGVGAILAEPVQGRGGIVVPHASFLTELREWCDQHGVLLVLDEIYTGFHRTGTLFACEATGIVPDLICLGKALSGGFPISACVGKSEIMDAWPDSRGEALHTSTFLGNPMGCAMAIAALDIHALPETSDNVTSTSLQLFESLNPLLSLPSVHQIRGRGLMLGIELRGTDGTPDAHLAIQTVTALLKDGIIVLPDGPEAHIIALTPPFRLTAEEINFTTARLRHHLSRDP